MRPSTRPLTSADAAPLAAAFAAIGWSKPAAVFRGYLEEQAAGARWTRVAEWEGELAGYVTVVWQSSDPELRRRGLPEVVDLNVLPSFRRRGIASLLLEEAEREAASRSGAVGIRVGLHAGYGAAQRLYVGRGYAPDGAGVVVGGRVPEEGALVRLDDETTLRMVKELKGVQGRGRGHGRGHGSS